LAGQLTPAGPAAYPLPPVPEKVEGGLATLDRLAQLRGDDLIDGGALGASDPLYALHPVTDVGAQYAERCLSYFASEPAPQAPEPAATGPSDVDVDELLLQVMPDRDKVGRLARLTGSLRYALDGGDRRAVDETVTEMQRVARHLGDKYRPSELIEAAQSTDPRAAQLAQLYIERCYRLADEDYAALAELDSQIDQLRTQTQ
jgi:hypothetical protein